MLDSDRARELAALFNHLGERWRECVPLDCTVRRIDGTPAVTVGVAMIRQDPGGGYWTVRPDHSWRFDGDDPYLVCECGERRDALAGRVITTGTGHDVEEETPRG